MKPLPLLLPLGAALLLSACTKQEEPAAQTTAPTPASEAWRDKGAELGAKAGETLGTLKDQGSQAASNVVEKTRDLADRAKAEGTKVVETAKELGTKAAEETRETTQKVVEGTREAVDKTVEAVQQGVQQGVRKLPQP